MTKQSVQDRQILIYLLRVCRWYHIKKAAYEKIKKLELEPAIESLSLEGFKDLLERQNDSVNMKAAESLMRQALESAVQKLGNSQYKEALKDIQDLSTVKDILSFYLKKRVN